MFRAAPVNVCLSPAVVAGVEAVGVVGVVVVAMAGACSRRASSDMPLPRRLPCVLATDDDSARLWVMETRASRSGVNAPEVLGSTSAHRPGIGSPVLRTDVLAR